MPQEIDVDLNPGHEWHSKAIQLKAGATVTLTATCPLRFYAGIYERPAYVRRKGAILGAFDFPAGTDRRAFTSRFVVEENDDYYIVLRLSMFAPRAARIHLRWDVSGMD